MRAADRRVALGLYRAGPSRELLQQALGLGVTAIDTACNYSRFNAHRELRQATGDFLYLFEITTKVGFFPDRHDLSPARVREAVERSAEDLGRVPDTVLLHNPEESPGQAADACRLMDSLRAEGWCGSWGISTWDPEPLTSLPYDGPAPGILMSRAGLMAPAAALDAADRLSALLTPARRWGMAPFGHNTHAPVWSDFDPAVFLAPGQAAAPLEAAFAAAFALPPVERVAVGTRRAGHLAQLQQARLLEPAPDVIASYRHMLRARASVSAPAAASTARENR